MPILDFLMLYQFFGASFAIAVFFHEIPSSIMFTTAMLLNAAVLLTGSFALNHLDYPRLHHRAILEKFASYADRKMQSIQKNSEEIVHYFENEFGHAGYYASVFFIAFSLGVFWAFVVAFVLKLSRIRSMVTAIVGSGVSFAFWYYSFKYGVTVIPREMFLLIAILLSIFFLFYGTIHEAHILHRIKHIHLKKKLKVYKSAFAEKINHPKA